MLFYCNLWYLLPYIFLKGKYLLYSLIVIVLLGGVYFLQPYEKLLGHNPRFQAQIAAIASRDSIAQLRQLPVIKGAGPDSLPMPFGPLPNQDLRMQEPEPKANKTNALWKHSSETDTVSLVLFLIITALALAVKTTEQWRSTEKKVIKAESEKVNAELSFLKAQINPHFLFNTLNNIYTLSLTQSEKTPVSIMKLSNIMRYVTDDVRSDFVPLDNEVKCIGDYIDLQKLRLGNKTIVDFSVEGDVTGRQIAPLIMMSFIENTFKYGISKKENCTIKIKINVEPGTISLYCENKIFSRQIAERSGIGIANTRHRLQLLYPGNYSLTIGDDDGLFKVNLVLNN